MSKKKKAKGKIVRRLGINIYGNPKYDRLLKRKPALPGAEKKGRRAKMSEYGKQLIEKQKLKFSYGLSEKQFRNVFIKAKHEGGVTGDNMLVLLERRLDNVVFRLGMATSRPQARQLVAHGHILVNGKKLDIASYSVKNLDKVSLVEKEKMRNVVAEVIAKNPNVVPDWLVMAKDKLEGFIERMPVRADVPTIADEQQVVELYAK